MILVTVGDKASPFCPPGQDSELLIVALSGVQRFIAESRTTADLRAASEMVARLAAEAARKLDGHAHVKLVFPASVAATPDQTDDIEETARRAVGVPNRIVALIEPGADPDPTTAAIQAINDLWETWLQQIFGKSPPQTPGMPSVQWIRVPVAGFDGYATRWSEGQRALVARRRVRDFAPVEVEGRNVCMLSPRWTAEDRPPRGTPKHERDQLSAANWLKRRWHRVDGDAADRVGFPSTNSIASALFRQRVLHHFDDHAVSRAVGDLHRAVQSLGVSSRETAVATLLEIRPGDAMARWFAADAGTWVYPGSWDARSLWKEVGPPRQPVPDGFPEKVATGARAARHLLTLMDPQGRPTPPPSYLALLAQDLDNMGLYLSGKGTARDGTRLTVGVQQHRGVSQRLVDLGGRQQEALTIEEILGVPVYAGGDDLLAFAPAATALAAARTVHAAVQADLPTASTAVVFFHRISSLQRAVGEVQALLKQAKDAHQDKDALGVGFLRRSGVREHSIQPWMLAAGGRVTDLFGVFAAPRGGPGLSPRLVSELERDEAELTKLASTYPDLFDAELTRLVLRHHGTVDDAATLLQLGRAERARRDSDLAVRGLNAPAGRRVPARAARVAVFLRQECANAAEQVMA
jgi:CRISPR-associated protein Cmr2